MKFSQTGLYIESYWKCSNCGVLIYEADAQDAARLVREEGNLYCSQECIDWKDAREQRKAGTVDPG